MNRSHQVVSGLLGLVVVTMVVGCDPLTRHHYDMITVHVDSKMDVEKMIGKPTRTIAAQWHYERAEKHLNVFVDFDQAGVVSRKQWVDSMADEWDDTQEAGDTSTRERTIIRTIDE